jgi:phage baseplate assembly protein W
MARTPATPSNVPPANVSLVPMLGAGWYFPVEHEVVSDDVPDDAKVRLAKLRIAADELSVRQSIEIILSTEKGERVMRPDFGCDLNKLLFAPNNGTTRALAEFEVSEALKSWEPRIEVFEVSAQTSGGNGELLLIDINYRVRTTDNRFNLVYPFYLNRALA